MFCFQYHSFPMLFNFQRLEQPECCPKDYYTIMLKCWQHDPGKRPRFCDLMDILPDVCA